MARLRRWRHDALDAHVGNEISVVLVVVFEIQNQQTHARDVRFFAIFLRDLDHFESRRVREIRRTTESQ